MIRAMATSPPAIDPRPPHREEDLDLTPAGWWAAGVVLGLAATAALALLVLINLTSEPTYTNRPEAGAAVGAAGEAQAAVTLIGTEFAFDPDAFVALPEATVTLDNQGLVVHNFVVEGVPEAEFVVLAEAGAAATGTLSLPAGDYVFFCSIPGHREAGMEGTMRVSGG